MTRRQPSIRAVMSRRTWYHPRVIDVARAQAADGDAWQTHGRLRAESGGAVGEAPGARMMVSGLPHAWWNNAVVHHADAVPIDELSGWYDERGLPWGVRVPVGSPWRHGELLFRQRLMALERSDFRPVSPVDGVTLRTAMESDLDVVAAVDAEAFGGESASEWLAPLLRSDEAVVAIASLDDRPVGAGYVLLSDGWAGPSALLAGVGVVPAARRRGIAAALSSRLLEIAFDRGANLSVLNPDTDAAARVYKRLGYVELPGFDIYAAE
jgi:ribosomal protein S18 acetylase RimI-like enzyme